MIFDRRKRRKRNYNLKELKKIQKPPKNRGNKNGMEEVKMKAGRKKWLAK